MEEVIERFFMVTPKQLTRLFTVYFVSGLPQPLRSGLDLPNVCAPDKATISCRSKKYLINITTYRGNKTTKSSLQFSLPCHLIPFYKRHFLNVQQVMKAQQLHAKLVLSKVSCEVEAKLVTQAAVQKKVGERKQKLQIITIRPYTSKFVGMGGKQLTNTHLIHKTIEIILTIIHQRINKVIGQQAHYSEPNQS